MKKLLIGLLALTSISSFAIESASLADVSIETIYENTGRGTSFYCYNKDVRNYQTDILKVKRVIVGEFIKYELYGQNGFEASCETVVR